jgi:hypothetical protein
MSRELAPRNLTKKERGNAHSIFSKVIPFAIVVGVVASSASHLFAQRRVGEHQSAGAGQTMHQLQELRLPDDAPSLADLVDQQVRAMPTVRVHVTTDIGGRASLEIFGMLHKPRGESLAAALKIVQMGGDEPGTTHAVLAGGALYVKQDGEEYAPGRPWLRIARQDLDSPDLGVLKQAFEEILNQVEHAVEQTSADSGLNIVAHGRVIEPPTWETLEAMTVRRYTGASNFAVLAEKANDPQLRQTSRRMASAGVLDLQWSIWVDKYGLPRQFASTLMLAPGAVAAKAVYTGWGEPVQIAAPPTDQVATIGN